MGLPRGQFFYLPPDEDAGCVGEPLHLLNADKVIPEDLSGGVGVPAAPGEDPAQVYPLPAQGPRLSGCVGYAGLPGVVLAYKLPLSGVSGDPAPRSARPSRFQPAAKYRKIRCVSSACMSSYPRKRCSTV